MAESIHSLATVAYRLAAERPSETLETELLKSAAIAMRDRLVRALNQEFELRSRVAESEDSALRTQWQNCRSNVEQFTKECIAAVNAYRCAATKLGL